ncbi:MAG: hypothetical protein ABR498_03570, partial [Candidatus Dormibacteria bacterium]
VAHGPVLRAYADYFGRTVNIASRLCDAAEPGEVLFHGATGIPDDSVWRAAALDTAHARRLNLKGISERLGTLRIRRRS